MTKWNAQIKKGMKKDVLVWRKIARGMESAASAPGFIEILSNGQKRRV